jgi:hypothetical protein
VVLDAQEGLAVQPRSFELTAVVPRPPVPIAASAGASDPQRSLWGILGVIALALTAVTALYVGRTKDDMLLVPVPPPAEPLARDTAPEPVASVAGGEDAAG